MTLNDVSIFKKIKAGDIYAFEILFRQYYEPLCRYSQQFTGKLQDAEEIVQDLFYKLWKDRENLQVISVKAYLYSAVRNNSLLYLKHEQVKRNYQESVIEKQKEANTQTPEDQMEYQELQKQLEDVMNLLPERRRAIFKMNRFEGKTYNEIAEILSVSVKTVEAEISKTLRTLKKELKN